jgi:hypothetical protein
MGNRLRAFQIHYDAATRAALDPAFEPLDNAGSERPDWFEYWPIRRFLRAGALDASTYYGFFSPRFRAKTQLGGAQVREFAARAGDAEVITFSPHPCHSACFLNVFEQAEFFYPGTLDASTRFLCETAPGFSMETCVMHSRNTVFSNFFLARPAFWRRWAAACERLFELSEDPGSPLHALLNRNHDYAKEGGPSRPVQVKVFVMERVASTLLQMEKTTVLNYPPFAMPLSERFAGRLTELMELDRLKIAFCDTGDPQHLHAYAAQRNKLMKAAYGGA